MFFTQGAKCLFLLSLKQILQNLNKLDKYGNERIIFAFTKFP